MAQFALVDKKCYEADKHHAPYEIIEAESRSEAKAKYHKMYPEYSYTDILCRKNCKNVFD